MWPHPDAPVNHTKKKCLKCAFISVFRALGWWDFLSSTLTYQITCQSLSSTQTACLWNESRNSRYLKHIHAGVPLHSDSRGIKGLFFHSTSQECQAEGIWSLLRCIIKWLRQSLELTTIFTNCDSHVTQVSPFL